MKSIFPALILCCVLFSVTAQSQKNQLVKLETAYGSCVIKLYNETPVHRDNFIRLVKNNYFNKTLFHRIIKNFVIQGGDPDTAYLYPALNKEQKWLEPEFNDSLFHKKGVLAMGRDDNKNKESFATQIYLVQGRTWTDEEMNRIEMKNGHIIPAAQREVYKKEGGLPFLDQNYTVFGEVVSGIELIDKLSSVLTNKGDVPQKKVWMNWKLLSYQGDSL